MRGDLYVLEDVPAAELRMLYRHAQVTVCPSFGEGFDFSGIEAMRCGSVVAASDIPVHHEIFADAADYFSPYSTAKLAQSLQRLMEPDGEQLRASLQAQGHIIADRYLPERILPQWQSFLDPLSTRAAH